MKNKPWLVYVITVGLLLVPFAFLARVLLNSNTLSSDQSMLRILLFALLSMFSFIVAYGVWKVRMWGFYSLIGFGLITAFLDLYAWAHQNFLFNWWFILDVTAVVAGITLVVQENVRKPYFNPKIKWWETPKRVRIDVPALVYANEKKKEILILDISKTGCFSDFDLPLDIGQNVKIDINHQSLKFVSEATVARRSENPRGYGLKFTNTDKTNKKQILQILKDLSAN